VNEIPHYYFHDAITGPVAPDLILEDVERAMLRTLMSLGFVVRVLLPIEEVESPWSVTIRLPNDDSGVRALGSSLAEACAVHLIAEMSNDLPASARTERFDVAHLG